MSDAVSLSRHPRVSALLKKLQRKRTGRSIKNGVTATSVRGGKPRRMGRSDSYDVRTSFLLSASLRDRPSSQHPVFTGSQVFYMKMSAVPGISPKTKTRAAFRIHSAEVVPISELRVAARNTAHRMYDQDMQTAMGDFDTQVTNRLASGEARDPHYRMSMVVQSISFHISVSGMQYHKNWYFESPSVGYFSNFKPSDSTFIARAHIMAPACFESQRSRKSNRIFPSLFGRHQLINFIHNFSNHNSWFGRQSNGEGTGQLLRCPTLFSFHDRTHHYRREDGWDDIPSTKTLKGVFHGFAAAWRTPGRRDGGITLVVFPRRAPDLSPRPASGQAFNIQYRHRGRVPDTPNLPRRAIFEDLLLSHPRGPPASSVISKKNARSRTLDRPVRCAASITQRSTEGASTIAQIAGQQTRRKEVQPKVQHYYVN
ncbi:hypothetical protein DFH09DRAFT_1109170 [Mycena vulgaris]|nr:hypothetical protein DFH09DRAFT_1109170 [Mycena vulgaris]